MESFDIIVIGKGLVGSAAAKYLKCNNQKIALIGTDEPKANETPLVYASHYDAARVQRLIGKDAVWTKLNIDAATQYKTMQIKTGISFHNAIGCLYVNAYGEDNYLKSFPIQANNNGVGYTTLNNLVDENMSYLGLTFPATASGVLEHSLSGYINPRELLKAQLQLFKNNGGIEISDTVTNLAISNKGTFNLNTKHGKTYCATKILVATGSFINQLPILPEKLQLTTKGEVVLLVKLELHDLEKFNKMPSLLYEIDEDETEGIYLLPPVKYPDGNYYIKIGCNMPNDIYLHSLTEIQHWFSTAKTDTFTSILKRAINKLIPSLHTENAITNKCIISRTATGKPYIGETNCKNLFVAGGCNGYSAMCSDAIGSVAAFLINNGFLPNDYLNNDFKIVYANS